MVFVFSLLCGGFFLFSSDIDYAIAGRLALSIMFLFSGISHLKYQEGIYLTYPSFLSPADKVRLVFAIGDLQFAFAAGLVFLDVATILIPFILIYLVLGLFTQVNARLRNISVKRGNYTGRGLSYLFFKVPEQLFILGWAYYFVLVCR